MGRINRWLKKINYDFKIIPLIAIGISILILLAWLIRQDAFIRLKVITDYVVVDLDESWTISLDLPLKLNSLYIDHIDVNASEKANLLPIVFSHEIDDRNVFLQSLSIEGKSKAQDVIIEMEASGSTLNLFVKNATIRGVYNKPKVQSNKYAKIDYNEPPETINFVTDFAQSMEIRIEFGIDDGWIFDNMRFNSLVVQKESPKGSGQFISRVKSGRVQVLNSGKEHLIGWRDNLKIKGIIENQRITIEKNPDGFKISFLGKVSIIDAGPVGFNVDLRPRLLECVYHAPFFTIFITLFPAMWGIFSVLKSNFKKKVTSQTVQKKRNLSLKQYPRKNRLRKQRRKILQREG